MYLVSTLADADETGHQTFFSIHASGPIYLGLMLTVCAQCVLIAALKDIVVGDGDGDGGSCSNDVDFVLRGVCLCILVAVVFETEVEECMRFRRFIRRYEGVLRTASLLLQDVD